MEKGAYQNYYVAFLDILGFKEIVKSNEFKEINAFIGKYDKEYLLKLLNYGLNDVSEDDPATNSLKIVQFSDSIVISVLSNTDYSFDILLLVLRDLIADCLLNHNILLRGGIAEGNFYINDNKLFGTALNKAYNLENSSAVYPRIIFTKELLNNYENKCLGSMLCRGITAVDEDDYYFVDYLFSLNWDLHFRSENKVWVEKYKAINEKVASMYTDLLSKETNNYVREKYVWLKHYYEKTQNKINSYFERNEIKMVEEVWDMDINLLISNIQNLCNRRNVSVNKMLKECTLKPSVVDNMKKGSFPSIDKVYLIAKYFNVSVDYLIGLDNKPNRNTPISDDKQRLLEMYDKLTDMEKGEILGELKTLTRDFPMAAAARSTSNSTPTKPNVDNLDDFPTMDEE